MATVKDVLLLIQKSGVDPVKIKLNTKAYNEIKAQVKDLIFIQVLNRKTETKKPS